MNILRILRPFVDRFPRAAALFRVVRDQLIVDQEPVITPWGFKLVGNSRMKEGTFEVEETKLVREKLDEVDVFLNIGANIGYYCCHALDLKKDVIAFEPMKNNLNYLYNNIKINNRKGVEIYPMALSNKVDVLEIYGDSTGASLHRGWAGIPENWVTLVQASTLNKVLGSNLFGKKVLVLIDVEGAEKWVLEGASDLIQSDPKPTWIIEIIANEQQPHGIVINPLFKETFDIFFDADYKACVIDDEMRKITKDEVSQIFEGKKKIKASNFMFY